MAVLFISSGFFGYSKSIKEKIQELYSTEVFLYEDRPSTGVFWKVFGRVLPSVAEMFAFSYFKKIAFSLRGSEVEEVFVIKGELLSIRSIKYLRKKFPNATFRLYFWDGYRNMPRSSRSKVDLFDHGFSFDIADVKNDNRLIYRPLFFVSGSKFEERNTGPDLLFLGTVHSDRYKIIKKIRKDARRKSYEFNCLAYFPSVFIFIARKIFDPAFIFAKKSEFIFRPVSPEGAANLTAGACAVLDVERHTQSGFTMRTLEVIGSRNKLVTTNRNVLDADFYHPANICVIDRGQPSVPVSFFRSPKVQVSEKIIDNYTLDAWVKFIFDYRA